MVNLFKRLLERMEYRHQYKAAVARKPLYDALIPLDRQQAQCGYCTLVPPAPRNLCSTHLIEFFDSRR